MNPARPSSGPSDSETEAASPARTSHATPPRGTDSGTWLAESTVHEGSWWAHWAQWVQAHSGAVERLPATGDGVRGGSLGPAPGRYVREK